MYLKNSLKICQKYLMVKIGPINRLFKIAAKRSESVLLHKNSNKSSNTLLHKPLSAPSFGCYWKQPIGRPYSNTVRAQFIQECIQRTSFSLTNANTSDWIWPQWYNADKKEWSYTDTLLIYTFWYDFLNDYDTQSDFGKHFVREKPVSWNHS